MANYSRLWVAAAALVCLAPAARADDPHPLPLLAANPAPPPSIWTGLSVGTEIVGAVGHGTKGFVGGDVFAGYDRAFDNRLLLGIEGASGYAPGYFGLGGIKGVDFATASVKLGYSLGRLTPYVTTGLVLAKPAIGLGGGPLSGDDPNALFATPGHLDAAPRVGAGFDYALTNRTSVGLAVSYGRGAATVFP